MTILSSAYIMLYKPTTVLVTCIEHEVYVLMAKGGKDYKR